MGQKYLIDTNIIFGDAIIGATAIVHELTLITNNTKDFLHVKGLRISDPHHL